MRNEKWAKINQILAEWNPIEVDNFLAFDEYTSYIPSILSSLHDERLLLECLEDILTNKMELEYDKNNKLHSENLLSIRDKIFKLGRESCAVVTDVWKRIWHYCNRKIYRQLNPAKNKE